MPLRIKVDPRALIPGERVLVRGTTIETLPPGAAREITVEASPVDPGEDGRAARWRVVLRVGPGLAEAAFSGTLTIETDHPRVPSIRVPFSGSTR